MGDYRRANVIYVIFAIGLFTLIYNAFKLQVLDNKYKQKAEVTAVKKRALFSNRGLVYDRNDKLLISNEFSYNISVIYKELDQKMDTSYLFKLLNITDSIYLSNINKNWSSAKYSKDVPFVFLSRLSSKEIAPFRENLFRYPGFTIQQKSIRKYPYPNAAHILGYISKINNKQLDKLGDKYNKNDYIGVSGIEKYYESILKGQNGIQYVYKDVLGREINSENNNLLNKIPVAGQDIKLSLDIELQKYGEELIQGKKGSIVAIDPKTGEILCAISGPTYDPNILSFNVNRNTSYNSLLQDTLKPLLNRAFNAQYPPASTFKTLVSLIALQEEVTYVNRTIYCPGYYEFANETWGCHLHTRPSNISIALEHSCNTYYYQLFRDIIDKNGYNNPKPGLTTFDNYLYNFGLGKKLGVDFPSENNGLVPTPKFYDRMYPKYKGSWKSPTIISVGIGQGEIESTTIQLANLAATLANRGYYYTPHFLTKNLTTQKSIDPKYTLKHTTLISKENFDPIIKGMENVFTRGTAAHLYNNDIKMCGKTGTSQNKARSHSVFFAFAPKDNPTIAIAVYIENAGFGATIAGPIATLLMERYINQNTTLDRRLGIENYIKNRKIKY